MHYMIFLAILALLPAAYAEKIPDYYNPYAPIYTDKQVYSWTDKVHITIDAPSWNENVYGVDSIGDYEGYFIKISTHGHTLEPYRLTETTSNSGLFAGEITLTGFLHDADGDGDTDTQPRTGGTGPTSGFLEADRDDGITISFEFADGVVLTQTALVRWNEGKIGFDKTSYLPEQNAKIQIIDPDLNLNPEASDTIPVKVSSDSDKAGITIDAIETHQDSGVFEADVSFSQIGTSSGNRLYAVLDDVIYARYEDNTLPSPYSINDSLDIVAKSLFGSQTHDSGNITFEDTTITDSFGNQVQQPAAGQQLQVVSQIQNNQNNKQPFVYLVQVKDSRDRVVLLSWFEGSMEANQKLSVSQSWVPSEPDTYLVEAFAWESVDNPLPLASPIRSEYKITQ